MMLGLRSARSTVISRRLSLQTVLVWMPGYLFDFDPRIA